MTITTIRTRVEELLISLGFTISQTPFSFDLQPTGLIDQVCRLEVESQAVFGWFNFLEERTDALIIWVARKYAGDPEAMYQRLLDDWSTIRSAIIRDGAVTSGEYFVPDEGSGAVLSREAGKEFAVLKLTVPVNYEVTV